MEKLELSPVELMQALNWKKSKVYYWINSGKFETVERLDGQKVVISTDDMERLRKSNSFENIETVSEFPNNSEKVQENSEQNITKNYKNVPNFSNSEAYELFNKSLETIERIHQNTLINFNNTTRLLTDSKSEVQQENIELRAEVKTVQAKLENSKKEKLELEKENLELKTEIQTVQKSLESIEISEQEKIKSLEKSQKLSFRKNIIIIILSLLLISFIGYNIISSKINNHAQPTTETTEVRE